MRRARNPPLQISLLDTEWCANEVHALADDAFSARAAQGDAEGSCLADGLTVCATRIQAQWRGRHQRQINSGSIHSELSEGSMRSEGSEGGVMRRRSPRAKAKWQSAIHTTSTLNDVVSHCATLGYPTQHPAAYCSVRCCLLPPPLLEPACPLSAAGSVGFGPLPSARALR